MRCFLGSLNRLLKRQISLVLQSVKYVSLLRVEYIQALEYNRRKYENVRKWEYDIKMNIKRTICVWCGSYWIGRCLTAGYGVASERASELIRRENLLRCRMSANYFSKNLCAMWKLDDQIIVSCLVGWSIDQLVNQFVNLVSWLASSASANSYRDCQLVNG